MRRAVRRTAPVAVLNGGSARILVGLKTPGPGPVLGHHVNDKPTPFILATFPSDYTSYIYRCRQHLTTRNRSPQAGIPPLGHKA